MNSVQSNYVIPKELINKFVKNENKFKERFVSLSEDMKFFIDVSNLTDEVYVNDLSLGYAILDYFEDIDRLKKFHKVEHVNGIKIVSYISYWLLRRKPIQLKENADKQSLYVNERFVLAYILDFLSGSSNKHILKMNRTGLDSFSESLLYYLKYRAISANSIELAITAFFAGQIFQEKETDLSSDLGKYYEDGFADEVENETQEQST